MDPILKASLLVMCALMVLRLIFKRKRERDSRRRLETKPPRD